MRDTREIGRAMASLAGLGVAMFAAVGVGSLLGGSDPRLPDSLRPETTIRSSISTMPSRQLLEGIFGSNSQPVETSEDADVAGNGSTSTPPVTTPADPAPGVDSPNTPVEVPETPDLLETESLAKFISDATSSPTPDPGLVGTVVKTLDDATSSLAGLLGR